AVRVLAVGPDQLLAAPQRVLAIEPAAPVVRLIDQLGPLLPDLPAAAPHAAGERLVQPQRAAGADGVWAVELAGDPLRRDQRRAERAGPGAAGAGAVPGGIGRAGDLGLGARLARQPRRLGSVGHPGVDLDPLDGADRRGRGLARRGSWDARSRATSRRRRQDP